MKFTTKRTLLPTAQMYRKQTATLRGRGASQSIHAFRTIRRKQRSTGLLTARRVNSGGARRVVVAAVAMGDHAAMQVRDRAATVGREQEWQHGVNQAREAGFG